MRIPEWTPPILGWQYKLHWLRNGSELTISSWDWEHWPTDSRYSISVDGSARGTNRIYWTVFFNVRDPRIGGCASWNRTTI